MSFNPVQPSITLYILLLTSAPVLFSPPLQGYGLTRGLVHLLLWKTYPPDTLHALFATLPCVVDRARLLAHQQ